LATPLSSSDCSGRFSILKLTVHTLDLHAKNDLYSTERLRTESGFCGACARKEGILCAKPGNGAKGWVYKRVWISDWLSHGWRIPVCLDHGFAQRGIGKGGSSIGLG